MTKLICLDSTFNAKGYQASLFRKKRFLVNLKIERNASKFAMFMEKDIDQGIHKGEMKVALNEKRKKLCGFSFSINIANFEAFL